MRKFLWGIRIRHMMGRSVNIPWRCTVDMVKNSSTKGPDASPFVDGKAFGPLVMISDYQTAALRKKTPSS